eukprot:4977195-Prymnesium_polylepis.2
MRAAVPLEAPCESAHTHSVASALTRGCGESLCVVRTLALSVSSAQPPRHGGHLRCANNTCCCGWAGGAGRVGRALGSQRANGPTSLSSFLLWGRVLREMCWVGAVSYTHLRAHETLMNL